MPHRHYNPDRYTRQTIRLTHRDYTWTNAYFVTIRAARPEPLFETLILRQLLLETWQSLPDHFPTISLDEFIIMPDHIHFILWLNNTQEKAPTLGNIVGAYKSIIAVSWLNHIKATKIECSGRIWQRNYYERVIRIAELEKTREYIRNNPAKLANHRTTPNPPTTQHHRT
jgi:REP element-mobilizing transposase RayT